MNFPLALVLIVVSFVSGAGVTALWPGQVRTPSVREQGGEYTYINPLLYCRNYEDSAFSLFAPLKRDLERITASSTHAGIIKSASVYIRDLTTGGWTGINEEEEYTPASLLKVPILIAYLKLTEKDPELLQDVVYYRQETGQKPPLVENPTLISDRYYTVEELLRGMIVDSDNSATAILERGLDKAFLENVYLELGIPNPYENISSYRISTRTYALFFRVLYNATLLNREMSEKAFSMLAEVKFDKGLRAGTPAEVPLAHKYGYHILKRDPPSSIELSDCGIVYIPDRPYLLCIMARGGNPEDTSVYMKDIAAAANHFFSQQR
jgi:beta-lactamase class A